MLWQGRWKSLEMILKTIQKSAVSLLPLCFILLVFMVIFASIGMQVG